MNKRFPTLGILAAILLVATAFGALVVQAQPAEKVGPSAAAYETLLGKSLNDQDVVDFLASNRCSSTGLFQLCHAAGVAMQVGHGQKVEMVYLYPNKTRDFEAYQGVLPLGLSAGDTLEAVEEKFGQPLVSQAPQAGWEPGLPDRSGTPDRVHLWATYERFGLTLVYNSPSATDKDATIYAIILSQ